jgi:hypothetical protein
MSCERAAAFLDCAEEALREEVIEKNSNCSKRIIKEPVYIYIECDNCVYF